MTKEILTKLLVKEITNIKTHLDVLLQGISDSYTAQLQRLGEKITSNFIENNPIEKPEAKLEDIKQA